jgi:hypothetical protein
VEDPLELGKAFLGVLSQAAVADTPAAAADGGVTCLCAVWCRRIALLAAGDLAVLLAFAAVGRHSHGEPLTVTDTFNTALPFIIGE